MALTLDKINQLRKTKANTVKYNSTEESRPYHRGELKKPEPLKILDEKLEKIEKRTEFLIEKNKQAELKNQSKNGNKPTPVLPQESPIPTQTLPHLKRDISKTTYMCMPDRKIPKQILKHIEKNIFKDGDDYFSKIDTYQLLEEIFPKKSAHYISKSIHRLKEEGWFEILKSSSSGYRLVKITIQYFQ